MLMDEQAPETGNETPPPQNQPPTITPEKLPDPIVISSSTEAANLNDVPKRSWFRPEIIFIPPLRRKLGTTARPLAAILIVVVLVGIGVFSYFKLDANHSIADSQPAFKLKVASFKLLSTDPANSSTNVNTATDIMLNFNQPVTPQKMINNMFVSPNVNGTFNQGKNPDQIIFTPDQPFSKGTKVSVMINGTFESAQGSQLGNPYQYNFTTSIPGDAVAFSDNNGFDETLVSLKSGQRDTFNLSLGGNVAAGASVSLYKDNLASLLDSLVYSSQPNGRTSYNDKAVSTSGLKPLYSLNNITNSTTFSVAEPSGIYVAVATSSSGKQLGLVWIDYASFGMLLRQDDQKTVYDVQSFSNSADIPASVSFYSLNGGVNLEDQTNADGLTSTSIPYSKVDLAIASANGEIAIVPVNIPYSGGDIRVDQNLSTATMVYAVTDKPTYAIGNKINFAGFVRNDNDALYTLPSETSVALYVATFKGAKPLESFSVPIGANGHFSGSIYANSSWLKANQPFTQLQIFASAVDGNPVNDLSVASFSVTNQVNPPQQITVSFSKSSYLPNEPITATVSATKNGQPLANTSIDLHIFSTDYYENNPAANLENFGYIGNELPGSPVTLELNSSGQATYTLKPSVLPNAGTSQLVTLEANLANTSGVGAAGGASAIVHQGNAVITFGPDRNLVPPGAALTASVYLNNLSGGILANTAVSYQLLDSYTNAVLASGTTTTNANGSASINIAASQLSSADGMELVVKTIDSYGNSVSASSYYSMYSGSYDSSGAELGELNITGSSTSVAVGDRVNLNISSLANLHALVTFDRGRIYNPQMVNLTKGNNSFDFTVGADLAPSFTLTFNYFYDGSYHSEGVTFNVANLANRASVTLNPVASSVSANQPTSLNINVSNSSGTGIASNLIAEVVSSNVYDLTSAVTPNIYRVLYNPRPIMTSSASSLSIIGSGGGRCGGGGGDLPSFANALGTTLYWQPDLTTNSSGQTTIIFTPPAGNWTVNVYAISGNGIVGSATTTISAH